MKTTVEQLMCPRYTNPQSNLKSCDASEQEIASGAAAMFRKCKRDTVNVVHRSPLCRLPPALVVCTVTHWSNNVLTNKLPHASLRLATPLLLTCRAIPLQLTP